MRVIKVNKKRGNIVLSRKAVLEEENAEKKRDTLETLEEGKVLMGTVKNITEYGAFVDLGGIDGLLHITDMSWGRINHPSEVLNVGRRDQGQGPEVRPRERARLARLQAAQGRSLDHGHPQVPGGRARQGQGRQPHRLRRVRRAGGGRRGPHPRLRDVLVQEGQAPVQDPDRGPGGRVPWCSASTRRRTASASASSRSRPTPGTQLVEKYPVGSKIKGKVRNLTEFGAFVEVEEGIDGLIHISDLSWTKRVKHPSEVLKKGDTVEAIVLNIDAENQRLSLGLKQLATDMWDEFFAHHKVGDIVEGKIVRLTNFGAFVELHEGIEGLVHVSELDEKRIEKPEEAFKVGETYPMKIIKINEGEKKIGSQHQGGQAGRVPEGPRELPGERQRSRALDHAWATRSGLPQAARKQDEQDAGAGGRSEYRVRGSSA